MQDILEAVRWETCPDALPLYTTIHDTTSRRKAGCNRHHLEKHLVCCAVLASA